jgi:hypothetical protein
MPKCFDALKKILLPSWSEKWVPLKYFFNFGNKYWTRNYKYEEQLPGHQKSSWSKVVMDWKRSVSTYLVWRFLRYERLAYKHLFLGVTEPVSQNTPTQFVRYAKNPSALLQSVVKNKSIWQILTFKKWLTQMPRQLLVFENPWPPLTKIISDIPV